MLVENVVIFEMHIDFIKQKWTADLNNHLLQDCLNFSYGLIVLFVNVKAYLPTMVRKENRSVLMNLV